jgi:hypothetical protein
MPRLTFGKELGMGFFEENPIVFVVAVVIVVEAWLRLRGPLFSMLSRGKVGERRKRPSGKSAISRNTR